MLEIETSEWKAAILFKNSVLHVCRTRAILLKWNPMLDALR